MPIDCSWIKKLGVAKSTCRQAASASGPRGQCGGMATSKVSASAAIRRTSEMPPAWARSGCKTATPASSAGSTSQREYIRSPVAIGTGLEEISRARFACLFSVSTGSSTKSGWYGSSCGSSRRAAGGRSPPREASWEAGAGAGAPPPGGRLGALRRPFLFNRRHPRLTLSTGGTGDVGWTVAADPTVDTHLVAHVAAQYLVHQHTERAS